MEKTAKRIASFFLKKEIITQEKYEWCVYSIERRLCRTISISILLVIGCMISSAWNVLGFMAGCMLLRRYTSGFHAKTYLGCLLGSMLVLIVSVSIIVPRLSQVSSMILLIVSSAVIIKLAPFNHPNMNFSKEELNVNRVRGRKCLFFLCVIAIVFEIMEYTAWAYSVITGVAVTAVLLLPANIQEQISRRCRNEQDSAA